MPIYRLIKEFEDRTTLPIDLNEVSDWLLAKGIQNEINFIPVDIDTGVIRGFLKRHKRHKGGWDPDPDYISNVYYGNDQDILWKNLVCAKELLHILDAANVTTKKQFDSLTQRLTLPNDLRHLIEDPDYVQVDKFGTAPACALLLPMAAREQLKKAYAQGLLTPAEIAKQAVMPVQHVRTVMSDEWPALYEHIKQM